MNENIYFPTNGFLIEPEIFDKKMECLLIYIYVATNN